MSGIVCAVRGGPTSRPTIDRAVDLALESGKTLYFLYVLNLDFLSYTESSRVRVLREELQEMGDMILLVAQEEAKGRGVRAETAIREGKVGEEIIEFSAEIEADFVVLGSPVGDGESDVFTTARFEAFVQNLEEETSAQVVLAEPDLP